MSSSVRVHVHVIGTCPLCIYPCSVQLCGFWTLPPSLSPVNPDRSLADIMKGLSSSPLLYVGFGSMETFMLDVSWEAVFNTLASGTCACTLLRQSVSVRQSMTVGQ